MVKRTRILLAEIADRHNLVLALSRAARGKRDRENIRHFLVNADKHLNRLARDILAARMPHGIFRTFHIFDPKKRLIHAACFPDRVFHHAVMNLAGPVFERTMVDHCYACRPGKGVHRAVHQVQKNLRRYSWYVKVDINGYFSSISHSRLLNILRRRFKGKEILQQFERIVACYHSTPGYGLPIGSLTSQYFANYYLDGLDRLLETDSSVRAMVRYMDDIVWWCDTKHEARQVLQQVQRYLDTERGLAVKPAIQILRSSQGISYCGFRILPAIMRMSRRRKRNFIRKRLEWEQHYRAGRITGIQLQNGVAAVYAIARGTDSLAWCRENLRRYPPPDV